MLRVSNSPSRQAEPFEQDVCWALLERVATSSHLRRAIRLRELLLYVGERSVREGCDHVSEHEIGVKVFGRPASYDNGNDSIVRTSISDLRKRVDAYFATEGLAEPIIMEIPRGSYIPVFYSRESRTATHPVLPRESVSEPAGEAEPIRPIKSRFDQFFRPVAVFVIVALAVACFTLWRDGRAAQQSLHPWKYQPAIKSLWSGLLDGDRPTDVVIEDSSLLLVQLISKQNISLSDYINRAYLGASSIKGVNPETDNNLLLISRKALAKTSDFRLGMEIKELDPRNPRLHFYNAREYTPRLLENDNVILLGSPTSNPWNQWFENSLNFVEVPEPSGTGPVINRSPKPGERAVYSSPNKTISYCAIAFLPKPDRSGNMLLIQGTTSEATEAGGEFVLSEDKLAGFEKLLHVTKLPYFELLLNVSQVLGTPLTGRVEAYRVYPNLH